MDCKACTKCGEVKALDAFSPSALGRAGRRADCKDCHAKHQREQPSNSESCRQWRMRNAAKVAAYRATPHRKELNKASSKLVCRRITRAYVSTLLKVPVASLTPELLEAKCQQLELHRLGRAIKKHLKETK